LVVSQELSPAAWMTAGLGLFGQAGLRFFFWAALACRMRENDLGILAIKSLE